MRMTKRHPKGYWGPRVMILIRAKNWNGRQTGEAFGCSWETVLKVIKGNSPNPGLVRKLIKLEELHADDIAVTQAAIEYRDGRLSAADYTRALERWVDASNRKVRPGDLAEVGVVGATGTGEDGPEHHASPLLRMVYPPPKRRVKPKGDKAFESGRPDDPDGGSDGAIEGSSA